MHMSADSTADREALKRMILSTLNEALFESFALDKFGNNATSASSPSAAAVGAGQQPQHNVSAHRDMLLHALAVQQQRKNQLMMQASASMAQHFAMSVLANNKQHQPHGSLLGGMAPPHPAIMYPASTAMMAQQHPRQAQVSKNALESLGGQLRTKNDEYVDVAAITDADPNSARVCRMARGGVLEHFPERLHRMLAEVEKDGLSDVVSFFPHGRAFGVHDMDRFLDEVMPKYFRQRKWNSFTRQLNLYGFIRITSGPDAGGYYHELFLKGRPNLCLHMRRVGVPQGEDRRKVKPKIIQSDPDFYSMKMLTTTTTNESSSLTTAAKPT